MSESSFPASDPPSAWTWEVKTRASTPDRRHSAAGLQLDLPWPT